jgi:hypothetical protein
MALRLAIADDAFTRRWLEGAFIRACIHNVTGEVIGIAAIKGAAPMSDQLSAVRKTERLQATGHSFQENIFYLSSL